MHSNPGNTGTWWQKDQAYRDGLASRRNMLIKYFMTTKTEGEKPHDFIIGYQKADSQFLAC